MRVPLRAPFHAPLAATRHDTPRRVPLLPAFLLGCALGAVAMMPAQALAQGKARPKTPVPVPARLTPALPPGDPAAGAEKADTERCQECHGSHGQGSPSGHFARLAGQHPAYIVRQVEAFRAKARQNDSMAIMARAVADEDLRDIAAYFASQPRVKGGGGGSEAARRLYAQGDAARGIPACVACHGADALGQSTPAITYPVLAGQEAQYLVNQFAEWRAGRRADSPDGVMVRIAKALTDTEINDLSQYLAQWP